MTTPRAEIGRLCDRLAVDFPIIQAPMAGVQDARLALAVGATGALWAGQAAPLARAAPAADIVAALRAGLSA